jgi:hypothetical protein
MLGEMKQLVRSKSDTNMFFEKQQLDLIHNNLKKLKHSKAINTRESKQRSTIRNSNNLKAPSKRQSKNVKGVYESN